MADTPRSLLDRIRAGNDAPDWHRFNKIYRPLLSAWLTKFFLQPADVDDVVQDVLLVVIAKVPTFKHNGHAGSFRSWLRGIVKHRLLTFWRQQQRHPVNGAAFDHFLTELEDDKSDIAKLLDDDHDRFVVGALLEAIKGDFQSGTWDLFWQTTILGEAIDAVAQRAGVTHNAVFIARSRVLQRLRQESAGLLDQ